MNYPVFKTSSLFRGRGSKRAMVAWFAVLVQLNIFFVLELHHHVVNPQNLRDPAAVAVSLTRPYPAVPQQPLCPACRISRSGAVQPAVQGLSFLSLPAIATSVWARPSIIPIFFYFHSSGRDPPRG